MTSGEWVVREVEDGGGVENLTWVVSLEEEEGGFDGKILKEGIIKDGTLEGGGFEEGGGGGGGGG